MKPNLSLKNYPLLIGLCMLPFISLNAQDLIHTKDGSKIEVKILVINQEEIQYKKYNNLDGPLYILPKTEATQIDFANGTVEYISNNQTSSKPSMAETQAFLIETINAHGFEEDNFKRRCDVSFEGDFLRLKIINKKGDKPVNAGLLYDFARVIKFQNVSDRGDKAFVNIWVMRQTNPDKDIWDKHKMVMRVDNAANAESILRALKHYSELLIEKQYKEKGSSKF
ncbi:hypothetical protein LRR18_12945 [Mangrovimonas sp. AS39]|uniref:hypothetical protein n=1 Tax=Mangrovimonas futianensis TaxID=2895523 RepID=UPI001E602F0D|nr:hypothetical protein [Mangrovimonas futianensis]MCF1192495.1 hypothetical protein [Mangrovimonas futianensis]MCF1196175.1 hypothetical protein [Mangrovimonas futianensis]